MDKCKGQFQALKAMPQLQLSTHIDNFMDMALQIDKESGNSGVDSLKPDGVPYDIAQAAISAVANASEHAMEIERRTKLLESEQRKIKALKQQKHIDALVAFVQLRVKYPGNTLIKDTVSSKGLMHSIAKCVDESNQLRNSYKEKSQALAAVDENLTVVQQQKDDLEMRIAQLKQKVMEQLNYNKQDSDELFNYLKS